jgi:hypothetical protein
MIRILRELRHNALGYFLNPLDVSCRLDIGGEQPVQD